jgi:hypothetical protein
MTYKSADEAVDDIGLDIQSDIRTNSIGFVSKWDPEKKLAEIVPVFLNFRATDGANFKFGEKPIPDVPVLFMRGGGFSETFPLKKGDPVLMLYIMRYMDDWYASDGQTQVTPSRQDMHSESDVIAIAGLFPGGNVKGRANGKDWILSHEDGKVALILEPGGKAHVVCESLHIGAESSSTPLAKGSTSNSNFGLVAGKVDVVAAVLGIPPLGALPSVESGKAFTND